MRKAFFVLAGTVSMAPAQNYTVQLPDSICQLGTSVTWEKRITQYCEGPAYESSTGYVYFTEQAGGANWPIWRIRPGTADTGIRWVTTRQNNGLEFDPQGRLVAAEDGRIARFTSTGTLDSALVSSGQNGVTFGQANDLSIGSNGAIYFTQNSTQVFYLSPTRQLSTAGTGFSGANGLEWLEEENNVYVNETGGSRVRRFPIQANGSLGTAANFVTVPSPDGGTVDSHGNRYVASYSMGEIRVFNAIGDSLGFIRLRFATGTYDRTAGATGNTDNAVFGGPANTILYMTGDGGLYSVQLRITGRTRPGTAIRPVSIHPVAEHKNALVDALGRWLRPEFYRLLFPRLLVPH